MRMSSLPFQGPTSRAGRRIRRFTPVALVAAALVAQPACTSVQRDSQSSSYLIISSMTGQSGAEKGSDDGVLASDVETKGGVFEDGGKATFTLGLKDPGTDTSPSVPSTTNFITITRYHVQYVRADGRNQQGVDVPYAFDGAATGTVNATGGSVVFSLVRVQAKLEAPLKALAGGGGAIVISTIAEVTFYGTDQAGRAVSVTGKIGVNFADWADPE